MPRPNAIAISMRVLRKAIWAIGALFCSVLIGLVTALTVLAASICPNCYGLRHIGHNIYAEAPNAAITSDVIRAQGMVAAVWGKLRANPRILICQSNQCQTRLDAGQALGMSYGAWAVHIGPKGINSTIIAHELAHAELFHRTGILPMALGQVPVWLNEGLAVIISQDARYLHRDCAQFSHTDLPQTAKDWRGKAAQDHMRLYPAAACKAKAWLAAQGGAAAFFNNFLPLASLSLATVIKPMPIDIGPYPILQFGFGGIACKVLQ